MNRIVSSLMAASAALILTANVTEAQRPVSVGVSAGLSSPISDLRDTHRHGWNAAVALNYNIPASNAGVRFEGFYNDFGAEQSVVAQRNGRIAGGTANMFYHLGGTAIRPYVIGGVGAYNSRFGGTESETNFGFNAGGGVKFNVGMLSTFAEARLHTISLGDGESRQFVPVVFGVEF